MPRPEPRGPIWRQWSVCRIYWVSDARRKPVLIRGMWGLGDNIFSRPFVRATAAQYEVHLETPWPELYADLDIRFIRGGRRLRTQQKNMARQPADLWSRPSAPMREVKINYFDLASR